MVDAETRAYERTLHVNLAEIRYTTARMYDGPFAYEYPDWLVALGIEPVDVGDDRLDASEHILRYNPTLDDSFALATADHIGATLLVGGDDDYDEIRDLPIERFRDGAG